MGADSFEEKEFRVGVFGGTFNPVHLGHVEIAQNVKNGFPLDQVLVIPSATPPHKTSENIAAAMDRFKMARLAFQGLDGFLVSDIELKRQGLSFTMDTIASLMETVSNRTRLFLMLGTDAFFDVHTWHHYERLLDSVSLIVMTRPGDLMDTPEQKKVKAGDFLNRCCGGGYWWQDDNQSFVHNSRCSLFFHDVTPMDISATQIRSDIRLGRRSTSSYLDERVLDYILEEGLYR